MYTQLSCDLIQLLDRNSSFTAFDPTEVGGGDAFLKVSKHHSLLLANVGQRCGDRVPEHSGVSLKSDCMPGLRSSTQCRIVKFVELMRLDVHPPGQEARPSAGRDDLNISLNRRHRATR